MRTSIRIIAAALAALLSLNVAAQDHHWAVVEFSVNFMRENPDYAAELGDQALMGTVVDMLDTSSYWVKIQSPEPYTAWVNDMGLVPMTEQELQDYLEAPKYICTAEHSLIYSEPSKDSPIVSEFVQGDLVRIMYKMITHTSGRYKGYDEGRAVLKKKFVGVVLPSGKTGYVPAGDVKVFYKWAKDSYELMGKESQFREALCETARKFVGVPYMWGGTSIKNVDCSGLARTVFFMNGVLLPRNASQQARVGEHVNIFREDGSVTWENLRPGDLIFWGRPSDGVNPERISHVGMYLGDGRFIHSSEVVRINSLDTEAEDYYKRVPVRARRVVGNVDKERSGILSVFTSPYYFAQK